MKKQTLKIVGMHCTACAMTIDLDLEEINGVRKAKTSYAKAETEVEFDPNVVSVDTLLSAIAKAGYTAKE